MADVREDSPATEYFTARSRTASIESRAAGEAICLAPIGDDGKCTIGVSNSAKRNYKDKRIYVNPRTGLPIRPPSSFGLYMHALRRSIKDGKVTFAEFHKKATSTWMKMSDEEKEPYVQRAKILAEQYKKIEVLYLRKKVRQLQGQVKEYHHQARSSYNESSQRRRQQHQSSSRARN